MKTGDVFDAWAARGRGEGMEQGHLVTAGPALAALPLRPGVRMLDIGTGNGWAVRHAVAAGADAVGIDVSAGMLVRARGAPVARADATALPFCDDAFDGVWSMEALYYTDPHAALREARRVVRDGGFLHVLVDYYAENAASHTWPDDVGVPMTLLSQDAWVAAAREAGFDAHARRLRSPRPADAGTWKAEVGTLHVHA